MKKMEVIKRIEETKTRSTWSKGVKEYAIELLDQLEDTDEITEKVLLNGAENWESYSWGGCSLIYNEDIAKRLCTQSELKRTKNGERRPNSSEQWLDTQARALYQASMLILRGF